MPWRNGSPVSERGPADDATQRESRKPQLIAIDGVDPAAVLAAARARARSRRRAAASASGTRRACFRSWRWPTTPPGSRRRERCCCSTPPISRSACAGRSVRRSPRAARSSPRRTSTPRWHSDAPPGLSSSWLMNLFRFAPRAHLQQFAHSQGSARRNGRAGIRRVQRGSDRGRDRRATADPRGHRGRAAQPLRPPRVALRTAAPRTSHLAPHGNYWTPRFGFVRRHLGADDVAAGLRPAGQETDRLLEVGVGVDLARRIGVVRVANLRRDPRDLRLQPRRVVRRRRRRGGRGGTTACMIESAHSRIVLQPQLARDPVPSTPAPPAGSACPRSRPRCCGGSSTDGLSQNVLLLSQGRNVYRFLSTKR